MTADRTVRRAAPTAGAAAPVPPPVDVRAARLAAQAAASSSRDSAQIAVVFAVPPSTADELLRVSAGAGVSVLELVAWLRASRHEVDLSPVAVAISRFRAGHGGHARSFLLEQPTVARARVVGGAS